MFVGSGHFEGGKNLTVGNTTGKGGDLASLLNNSAVKLVSAATAGGAATETLAVTGLKASDEIVNVMIVTKGANAVALAGHSGQTADSLDVDFTADPGAGAVLHVFVRRAPTA